MVLVTLAYILLFLWSRYDRIRWSRYQLVRYRLGEKFIIASCIEAMRPAAMALLERGVEGAMLE